MAADSERLGMIGRGTVRGAKLHTPTKADAKFAAGAAMLAWGVPRLRFLGPALARGRASSEVLDYAGSVTASVEAATRVPELALRRNRMVNAAVEAVPSGLRGEVATASGAALIASSRHDRRIPRPTVVVVNGRNVTGW